MSGFAEYMGSRRTKPVTSAAEKAQHILGQEQSCWHLNRVLEHNMDSPLTNSHFT